jgi:hypothetical protein
MSHDAEALLRANAGVRVQRFAVHIIESSEPAKTVTSLFTLLSVLAGEFIPKFSIYNYYYQSH